jgi:hypothetical protein
VDHRPHPGSQTPGIPTRVFPGVRQPLAIGLFLRDPGTSSDIPAVIRHRAVAGRQQDKFDALAVVQLDGDGWREVRTGWADPFTPAAAGDWDSFPAISALMPWYSPGVFPTRTWVYAPAPETLRTRWRILIGEKDPAVQSGLFKEGNDATMDKAKPPLPGTGTHHASAGSLRHDAVTQPAPVRIGYRSFDRQWALPHARLMDRSRRDLWAARIPGQVFAIEQHSQFIPGGPGIVFTALIPDFHHFNGRGGRTLPALHPDGSPNLAPGLPSALAAVLGRKVTAADVVAYAAAVVAHPAYTLRFAGELATPGIRVPLTADPQLWEEAVTAGREVIWLHTYGAEYTSPERPADDIRMPAGDPRQPMCTRAISGMPAAISYDEGRAVLLAGDGEFAPVPREAWEYSVGGGKKNYPLDLVHPETWDPDWTTELIDLLTVLTRLTALEPAQAEPTARILNGPLIPAADLETAGTRWPKTQQDRNLRHNYSSLETSGTAGQLTLGD